MEVRDQDRAGSWLEIRLVAGKQSITSELESYQVRTVNILDRRDYRMKLRPLPHTSGMEFKYNLGVFAGYPEELQSGGIAVGIHVVSARVFGNPKRRRIAVRGDWQCESR